MQRSNILIGVTGSVAAYKVPDLVRLFRAKGASVRVVLTAAAEGFVAPFCLEVLTEAPVYRYQDHLDADHKMNHIELARWADHILIAPASAHCLAQLAHGLCGDLLTTLCLASKASLWVAPAMNVNMWEAIATQANVGLLQSRGVRFLGPDVGLQACGDMGLGRMLPIEMIVEKVLAAPQSSLWMGKKVVITGGPTREAIDPVRYLSNHSTGHMAYALAKMACEKGADVRLITGPTHLPIPHGVQGIPVTTADEMFEAALQEARGADLFIGAAAVADYKLENVVHHKLKRSNEAFSLTLTPNRDIVAAVAHAADRPQCVVGFAAETEHLEAHAQKKLIAKGLDAIVANRVGEGLGFGDGPHEAVFITPHRAPVYLPKVDKIKLAGLILNELEVLMQRIMLVGSIDTHYLNA